MLLIEDWKVKRNVKLQGSINLDTSLLLPGFDYESFPFMLDYATTIEDGHSVKKSRNYTLVNLRTGRVNTLLKGSSQNIMP